MSSLHSPSSSQDASRLICPYCGQDEVWEVRLKELEQNVVMCLECDTVWPAPDDMEYGKGLNFEDFMAEHGRRADWTAIVKLEKLVEKPS
jgi:uncharacterized Zn finger protein